MSRRIQLAGSRRAHLTDEPIGALAPGKRVTVTLHLKDPSEPHREPGTAEDFAALTEPTTRAALARRRQQQFADAERLARAFAAAHGLEVAEVDLARRLIRLRAPADTLAVAFATRLARYRAGNRHYHANTEPLHVPEELAPWLRGVLGLDTQPTRRRRRLTPFVPAAGTTATPALWPADIARLYGIHAPNAGAGQCIGIIAPSGGYLPGDCALVAQHIGAPFPDIAEVSIDNGSNRFGRAPLADQELALDLQTVAAIAPAAKIVIYFTNDSAQGLADAVLAAVHDDAHRPHVVSISWGTSEAQWQQQPFALDVANGALADSVTLGVVVTAAAGDALATNGADDDLVHVNFPASSPYVLSCGGTQITLDAAGTSIASEVVWNDDGERGTGGGISDLFVVPDYQQGVAVPVSVSTNKAGRGVPDVAAAAAFINGYRIVVNRQEIVQGGTSAVAPLWAGLTALINAERGASIQRIHPALYGDAALFRSITSGDNKSGPLGYDATAGWNACTGLGVPIGAAILAKLTAMA